MQVVSASVPSPPQTWQRHNSVNDREQSPTEYTIYPQRIKRQLTLDSSIWQHLPPEITDTVLDKLGEQAALSSRSQEIEPWVKTHVFVCRHWYCRLAPFLYRSLRIIDGGVIGTSQFLSRLRAPNNPYTRYTHYVHLCKFHDLTQVNIGLLATLLPHAMSLDLAEMDWRASSHPALGEMLAASWGKLKNLASLRLKGITFRSSSDVLRILATIPSLRDASLDNISWKDSSDVVSWRKCNRMEHIDIENPTKLSALLWFWVHPHPNLHPSLPYDGYPGLRLNDTQVLTRMVNNLSALTTPHVSMRLEQSVYPRTWILLIATSGVLDLEVHITNDHTSDEGFIRWLVFRSSYMPVRGDKLRHIEDINHSLSTSLSMLPNIHRVVIEIDSDDKYPWMASIDTAEGVVHMWTHEEARAYAVDVCKTGVPETDILPVSSKYLLSAEEPLSSLLRSTGESRDPRRGI